MATTGSPVAYPGTAPTLLEMSGLAQFVVVGVGRVVSSSSRRRGSRRSRSRTATAAATTTTTNIGYCSRCRWSVAQSQLYLRGLGFQEGTEQVPGALKNHSKQISRGTVSTSTASTGSECCYPDCANSGRVCNTEEQSPFCTSSAANCRSCGGELCTGAGGPPTTTPTVPTTVSSTTAATTTSEGSTTEKGHS